MRYWIDFLFKSQSNRAAPKRISRISLLGKILACTSIIVATTITIFSVSSRQLYQATLADGQNETLSPDRSDELIDKENNFSQSVSLHMRAQEAHHIQDNLGATETKINTPPRASDKSLKSLQDILETALEPDATPSERRDAANTNLACTFSPASDAELAQASQMRLISEMLVRRWYDDVCDQTTGLIDPATAREWWRLSPNDPHEAELIYLTELLEYAKESGDVDLTIEILNAIEVLVLTTLNPTVIRQGAIIRAGSSTAPWRLGEAELSGTVWWMLGEHRRQYQQVWSELLACNYANDCGEFGARTIALCRDHAVCHEGQNSSTVLRLIFPPALFYTAETHVDRFRHDRGY